MLNIEVLSEEEELLRIKVWIRKRHLDSEPILLYRASEIKSEIAKQLEKKYKNCDITFSSDIRKLKNHNSRSLTEQNVFVKVGDKKKSSTKRASKTVKKIENL